MGAPQQIQAATGFRPPAIASLAAWYDASVLSSLWQDSARTTAITADAQTVGSWDDLSGNGQHLLQATAANEPTYRATGTYLDFDGSNDHLEATFTLNHPCSVFLVVNQQTWTNAERLFNGITTNTGIIRQTNAGASPELSLYNGTAQVCTNNGLPLATWGVLTAIFNGASSALRVDGTSEITGNPGSSNLGGIVIGAFSDGTAAADMFISEAVIYSGALSATNQSTVRDYLKRKWGTP